MAVPVCQWRGCDTSHMKIIESLRTYGCTYCVLTGLGVIYFLIPILYINIVQGACVASVICCSWEHNKSFIVMRRVQTQS